MPHFGLMDAEALGPEEAALMRAKLHIRAGKRRLRQNKISLGILTLYDAVVSALSWYVLSPERVNRLDVREGDDLKDDRTVFAVLSRSGKIDDSMDYDHFNDLVERALEQELDNYEYGNMLREVESFMTQLGVMPFDENALPPEDPATV